MQEPRLSPSGLTDETALRAAGVSYGAPGGPIGPGETTSSPAALDPRIRGLLGRLRRRIRLYVWFEGLALAVGWVGLAFWITLGLDYSIEPPAIVRQLMVGAAVVGLLWVLWRYVVRRLSASISSADLAMLLERRFKRFDDSLLTTVELAEHPSHATQFNARMLSHTQSQAIDQLPHARLAQLFNRGPLARAFLAALLGAASIGAFAALESGSLSVWADRNLMFSDQLWPRRTRLALVGFENKKIKIAKGSDLNIVVRADTHYEIPQSVQLRYRTDEGRSRENMSRVGIAEPGFPYQEFAFTFRGILTSRTFDVVGGDAALRGFEIEVVDVPTIEMTVHFDYPKYTRREPADRRVSSSMEAPQGTAITILAKANKDLVEAPIAALVGDKIQPLQTIHLQGQPQPRQFNYRIEHLDEDRTLLFTLVDVDGIRSREPIRLILRATPDEPPRVGVHLRGISASITPQARLPIEGEIADDYGLAKLWFRYKVNETDPVDVPLRLAPKGRTSLKFNRASDEAIDFKERKLAVGQQVTLEIAAEDNCALPSGANHAMSEKFPLSVVEPEQLLTLLEARELQFRMRLEAIVQDLTATRDQLADARIGPSPDKKEVPAKARAKESATAVGDGKPAAVAEPEPAARSGSGAAPATEHEDNGPGLHSPQVATEQALANSERGASETMSLADAFDDIRDEMSNNRIDTPALEYRLKDQISEPLRRIGGTMFPDLDRRLRRLQETLADPRAAKAQHADAVKQIDAILAEMRVVLSKMLELESFNEIVEQLRAMLDGQDRLDAATQKHKNKKYSTSTTDSPSDSRPLPARIGDLLDAMQPGRFERL